MIHPFVKLLKPSSSSLFLVAIRYRRRNMNETAGIGLRRKMINDNQVEEDIEDDGFESDFQNVGHLHRDHMAQIASLKENTRYSIVARKYFAKKMPNFLTYSEKQQIKLLHNSNPDEWTIEKLSQSFPATSAVIKQIIKGNWTKKKHQIPHHDETVMSNWRKLKAGEYDDILTKDVKDHLKSFTDRSLNANWQYQDITSDAKPASSPSSLPNGEFSKIIQSYERHRQPIKLSSDEDVNIDHKPLKETYLTVARQEFIKNTPTKCPGLHEKTEAVHNRQSDGEGEHEVIVLPTKPLTNAEERAIIAKKYSNNSELLRAVSTKPSKNYDYLTYPERIKVPKNGKRNLYKLKDCYYDSDGQFLYRVPGMTD